MAVEAPVINGDAKHPTRPHSSSNVHFADIPQHRPSISSFRSHQPLSYHASSSPESTPPPPPQAPRRSSQDRRIRSEGVLRSPRPSLIGRKRASAVTGGYESSSSSEDDTGSSHALNSHRDLSAGRRRAHSMVSPLEPSVGPNRPTVQSAIPAGMRGYRDAPSRIPSAFNGMPPRPEDSGPSRSSSTKSPPSYSRELNPSPESSRKGKERERDGHHYQRSRQTLAASLGLTDLRGTALSPEQLHDLLGNSDVGVALRMINNFSVPPPSVAPAPAPPPDHHKPYLVTAPPPLTTTMNGQRERNISISSTLPRSTSLGFSDEDHERRRRRSSTVVEPQGGHIPFTHHVTRVEEDEDTSPSMVPHADEAHLAAASRSQTPTPAPAADMKRSKSRLSGLFHKAKKHEPPDSKSKEKYERDLEIRRKEQDRRDEELAQERRFRALTLISAHPESERMAYRTSCHLRALYTHVYDGVENPPRLNLLAVLRWKGKTEEQMEAKRQWQQLHADQAKQPTSFPSAWAMSSTSLGAPSKKSKPRWTYTIDDIEAYKEANGVVNYFVPPRPAFLESSKADSSKAESSKADSSKADSKPKPNIEKVLPGRFTSPSVVSLAPTTSPQSSVAALSRTATQDTRQYKGHRSHQSLSAMNPSSLAHALKVPFERLNRKQRTLPMESGSLRDKLPPRDFHPVFLRRENHPATDDERHDFQLRKLFLKGQRVLPDVKTDTRDEIDSLQKALERETAFRHRQAEATRKTELEREAEMRLQAAEQQLYEQKSRSVMNARRRVDVIEGSMNALDEAMRHYLLQVTQIQVVARSSAEIDIQFPGLQDIQSDYQDYGTSSSILPSLYTFGMKPWSRRTALDPGGPMRIDPVKRVDVTLEHARARHHDMLRARQTTTEALYAMIHDVDERIRQKDEVREWTRNALERNRSLQETINQLQREIKGNFRARLDRWKDRQTDLFFRQVLVRLTQYIVAWMTLLLWLLSYFMFWRTVRLPLPGWYVWLNAVAGSALFVGLPLLCWWYLTRSGESPT